LRNTGMVEKIMRGECTLDWSQSDVFLVIMCVYMSNCCHCVCHSLCLCSVGQEILPSTAEILRTIHGRIWRRPT